MNLWKRVAGAVILALVLLYGGDSLFVRIRVAYPKLGAAFGTVEMQRLYAIPLNSGKTEYEFDARQPVVTMPCVHSLLPHMGNPPCWYLRRQSQKPIPMVIMPSVRP